MRLISMAEKKHPGLQLLGVVNITLGLAGIVIAILVLYFGFRFSENFFGYTDFVIYFKLGLIASMGFLSIISIAMIIVGLGLIFNKVWAYYISWIMAVIGLVGSVITFRVFLAIFFGFMLIYLWYIHRHQNPEFCGEEGISDLLCYKPGE